MFFLHKIELQVYMFNYICSINAFLQNKNKFIKWKYLNVKIHNSSNIYFPLQHMCTRILKMCGNLTDERSRPGKDSSINSRSS